MSKSYASLLEDYCKVQMNTFLINSSPKMVYKYFGCLMKKLSVFSCFDLTLYSTFPSTSITVFLKGGPTSNDGLCYMQCVKPLASVYCQHCHALNQQHCLSLKIVILEDFQNSGKFTTYEDRLSMNQYFLQESFYRLKETIDNLFK